MGKIRKGERLRFVCQHRSLKRFLIPSPPYPRRYDMGVIAGGENRGHGARLPNLS